MDLTPAEVQHALMREPILLRNPCLSKPGFRSCLLSCSVPRRSSLHTAVTMQHLVPKR